MSKVSSIVTVAGWAQSAESVSQTISARFSALPCLATSPQSLLSEVNQEEKAFRAGIPSHYVAALSAHLSPVHDTAIVATSMGSLIALEAALHFSDRVSKLVLLNGTSCFTRKKSEVLGERPGMPRSMVRAMRFGLRTAPRLTLENFFSRASSRQTELEQKVSNALEGDVAKLLHGLEYLERADLSGALASIKQEVLVLHGEDDKIIPLQAGKYLADKLPNCSFKTIAAGSHELPSERSDELQPIIEDFLQQ